MWTYDGNGNLVCVCTCYLAVLKIKLSVGVQSAVVPLAWRKQIACLPKVIVMVRRALSCLLQDTVPGLGGAQNKAFQGLSPPTLAE